MTRSEKAKNRTVEYETPEQNEKRRFWVGMDGIKTTGEGKGRF